MGYTSAHCNNILSQQLLHIDEQNINLKPQSITSTDPQFSHFGMTNISTPHSPHLEKDPNTTITECPETNIDIEIEEETRLSSQTCNLLPLPTKLTPLPLIFHKNVQCSRLHLQNLLPTLLISIINHKKARVNRKKNKKSYYVRLFHNIGERILYDRKLLLKHQQPANKLPPIQLHTRSFLKQVNKYSLVGK